MWNLKFRKSIPVAIGTLLTAFTQGCSLEGKNDGASLYVDLSAISEQGSRFSLLDSGGNFIGLTSPPTSVSAFSCYAVNVTGPGISDSGSGNHNGDPMVDFYRTLNESGRYCSYRGVVTPPLYLNSAAGSEVSLQIPPGGVRLVQIVGVNDLAVCQSGVIDDPVGSATNSSSGGRFFEVGRAVLKDVFGDRSVGVSLDWPTTATAQAARSMDCGGNCELIDAYSAGASAATFSTITKYAQKIETSPGKYIRSIDLRMTMVAAGSVSVEIYEAGSASVVPATATGYVSTRALAVASLDSYSFDMHTANGYLQMQAGYEYWIVVSGPTSSSWSYLTGAGVTGNAQYTPSTWSTMSGNNGFDYRINECDN
jgi:hypothetical protein